VVALQEPELDGALPRVGGDVGGLGPAFETPWTSWWVGLVGVDGGPSLLVGALTATSTKVWTAWSPEQAWLVWGGRGETVVLGPDATKRLDPVWLAAGDDPWQLHRDYAEQVAQRTPPRPLEGTLPPTGWATWYVFYSEVTEEDVRRNLEVLAAEDRIGLDLVQIDDGWQPVWGQWEADEGFPSGMGTLARDIQDAG
jgi:hypothetical protein